MIFRIAILSFIITLSFLFGNDSIIDLKTFPRPTMYTSVVNGHIVLDGHVDEAAWMQADSITEFYQSQPNPGHLPSERTVVRVLYDKDYLYVSAVLYDSEPDKIIIESLEQDFDSQSSDAFALMLDTFNDDKSGYVFLFNPAGAIKDIYINNDGTSMNRAWEGIVYPKTSIHDYGWEIELAFPLTSLRFNPSDGEQDWGINFLRRVRRKREDVYWSPIEPFEKLISVSKGGTLKGLRNIQPGRNLQVKPFIIGNQIRAEEKTKNSDAGIDVKFSITPSLTLDATYNTDFSQVEADEERVNLTRFPLFFPEKRDFFLENASLFEFGDISNYLYRMSPSRYRRSFSMFHSRRIGLEDGEQIPITGGARLSGKIGNFDVGYINMTAEGTENIPQTQFNVSRIRGNFLKKSNFGAILIDRNSNGEDRDHQSMGLDLNFNINKILIYTYFAQTENPETEGENTAGRVAVAYRDNKWDLSAYYKKVGREFRPQVGFIQRTNVGESFVTAGIHKRYSSGRFLSLNPYVFVNQFDNLDGYMESRNLKAGLDIQFMSGAMLFSGIIRSEENIKTPFTIYGAEVPADEYVFNSLGLYYRGDRTKFITINGNASLGDYFHGKRNSVGISASIKRGYRFSVDIGMNKNMVKFPDSTVNADVYTLKVKYNHSVKLLNTLYFQYNAADEKLVSNFRMNLIHAPLSDLFLVYSNISDLKGVEKNNGMIALKFTKLFAL
ncbi:MAG: carbohydrate binding family 9 domain-containing protein [Candidatus Marinimicrobia bacterium]|nr:carbohydrate binding family 9 domain-containing protein [Candidatus Neomarinimicrobiota bacterium]MBT3675554.1 carbohydrate binding family 9 domain-containing protein [Candidatus Neomarinimicrobiota bacterium]MBT3762483.1 carbohydrate binding family 9 domain-containing protein [Candidatus Neomarinimicrobiota bacterium]MBT4067632.1 carbohydrate binding family 9 domain-containing protein [Candidatus Neomarinimicrobiota bacterium]MBT4271416.1 carbohydrate binding family 9 domain-containing prot